MDTLLHTLKFSSMLKNLPRGGWLMKGVRTPESLADHSYSVAFIAMQLADAIRRQGIAEPSLERVLRLALIHDLPESIITDIPAPMTRYFGAENKRRAEEAALADIMGGTPAFEEYRELFAEFEERRTIEGRIVRAADKIDMMLMVLHYEETGHRNLGEFWTDGDRIFFNDMTGGDREVAFFQSIYAALKSRRGGGAQQ